MRAFPIACALVLVACLGACGNDNLELTTFAKDLVENHTRDDTQPTDIEATPFSDSENANAFSASFFL